MATELKPPARSDQPPVFNIADARLMARPDGSGADAIFTILGAFTVSLAFPANVVDDFLKQWVQIKRNLANIALTVNKIHQSKI